MDFVRPVAAVKAAGFDVEPVARTEQRPGRGIGEQHPRGTIDQHYAPLQTFKPGGRGIMVEIAQSKLSMNSHGAVDMGQRGLEGKRLLFAYVIVLRRIGDANQSRNLVPDEQIGGNRRKPELGRAKPLVEHGVVEKSFRDMMLSNEKTVPSGRLVMRGQSGLWKAQ